MKQCQRCSRNDWDISKKRDLELVQDEEMKKTWIQAKCKWCGNIITFGHKYAPLKEGVKAEYEIRDGKHFLKINGIFKEVRLCTVNKKGQVDAFGDFLKVMPI